MASPPPPHPTGFSIADGSPNPGLADRWQRPWIAALWTLLVCSLAWFSGRPPAPVPTDAPRDVFSSGRALEVLEQITEQPHPVGSPEHERVRQYLADELRNFGFEVEIQETVAGRRGGSIVRVVSLRNIVARFPGSDPSGGVALTAHYDSRELASGAGDDGAGVAAILESLRALQPDLPLRNDLFVLITDAEEIGLFGAQGFVDEHRWANQIDVVVNLEGRGAAGPSLMFETAEGNDWVIRQYARADPRPIGNSLGYEVYKRLPNDTDFTRFREGGIVGLNFAFIEAGDRYHRATDDVPFLAEASLQHHGIHALALARHFGDIDLAPARPGAGRGERSPPPSATGAANRTYFDFPVIGIVHYPMRWATPLSALAVLLALVVIVLTWRRGRLELTGVLVGAVVVPVAATLAWGGGIAVWRLAQGLHAELGALGGSALYYERPYALATMAAAVAALAATWALARRWFEAVSLATGALTVGLAATVGSALVAPGANMLLLWPVLLGWIAVGVEAGDGATHTRWMTPLLMAVPALVFVTTVPPQSPWRVLSGVSSSVGSPRNAPPCRRCSTRSTTTRVAPGG